MSDHTFGSYLLSQNKAAGAVGELAQAAARDPRFPRSGTPKDVSRVLNAQGAPAEFHEALEDLEAEWRNLATC